MQLEQERDFDRIGASYLQLAPQWRQPDNLMWQTKCRRVYRIKDPLDVKLALFDDKDRLLSVGTVWEVGDRILLGTGGWTNPEFRRRGDIYMLYRAVIESGYIAISDFSHVPQIQHAWRVLARKYMVFNYYGELLDPEDINEQYNGTGQRMIVMESTEHLDRWRAHIAKY